MTSDKKLKEMIQRIYVLNTSAKLLSIQIDTMAGKEFSVTIPNTWIPVDLTDQAKFRDIIESPSFNRAERLGKIKILDTVEAEQILSTKDAKLERNRLDSGVFNVVEIEENPASDTVDYDSEDYTNRNLIVSAVDEPAAINQFRIISKQETAYPAPCGNDGGRYAMKKTGKIFSSIFLSFRTRTAGKRINRIVKMNPGN